MVSKQKKQNEEQITKAEKIGRWPRWFANFLKSGRIKLGDWDVSDTAHYDELLKKIETDDGLKRQVDWKKLATWLSENGQTGVKISGVATLWTLEMLTRLLNALVLDNSALRAMESKFKSQKVKSYKNSNALTKTATGVQKFSKNNPAFLSYVLYYAMLIGVTVGGTALVDVFTEDDNSKKKIEEKSAEETPRDVLAVETGTYGAYLEKMRPIIPLVVADLIAKEGVRLNGAGLHVPYLDSTGKPTIGFGSTRLKDNTIVTMNTPPITTEQAYELARYHLETETFFLMYCYDVGVKGVDIDNTETAFGFASIMYNAATKLIEDPNDTNHKERFTLLRRLYQEYGVALPNELVVQAFKDYPITNSRSFGEAWINGESQKVLGDKLGGFVREGKGLWWRRWLEAGVLTGKITPDMLLQCPANGMYEFFMYKGGKTSAFFTGDANGRHNNRRVVNKTYDDFREWLKAPVNSKGQSLRSWKKVQDYLPADALEMCLSGQCKLGGNVPFEILPSLFEERENEVEVQTYVIGYDELYDDALASFKDRDFASAAKKYENMIASYPDNALLRNDLAATYIELGEYDKAIEQVRDIIHRISDKTQYAAAYYNAGRAYEYKGELQKALANYKLAVANGNKRVQKDVTRLSEQISAGVSRKRVALHSGIKRMHQRNAKKDLLLYGKKYDNNIA